MATSDQHITTYSLQARGFQTGASQVVAANAAIVDSMAVAKGATLSLATTIAGTFGFAGAASVAGILAGILGLGTAASSSAADFEALKMGLVAVMGTASAATSEIKRLREVAKAPGLGFREALQGSIALQAAGLSADMAARAIKAFGNALATVGKGKAEFELVQYALSQIASAPKVLGQDVRQLQQQLPQLRMAMIKAFGTASPQDLEALNISPQGFISSLVAEFEKLPQVTSGAKNAFDNLKDAGYQAMVAIGTSINQKVVPAIDSVYTQLMNMVDHGVFEFVAKGMVSAFGDASVADNAKDAISWVLAGLKQLPTFLMNFARSAKNVFAWLVNNIELMMALIGGFLYGPAIVAGFRALIAAIMGVRTAMQALAVVGAIVDAILTKGAGWAASLAAMATSAAVLYGAFKLIERHFPASAIPDALGFDMGQLTADAAVIRNAMGLPAKVPTPASGQGSAPGTGESPIIRYVRETAENTRKMAHDLRRNIVGGGDLGRMGVTPVELRGRGTGNRRASHIGKALDTLEEAIMREIGDLVGSYSTSAKRAGAW